MAWERVLDVAGITEDLESSNGTRSLTLASLDIRRFPGEVRRPAQPFGKMTTATGYRLPLHFQDPEVLLRRAVNLTTLREGAPNFSRPPCTPISPWWRLRRRERNFHGTSPAPRYDCPPGRSQTWQSKISPAVRTTNKTFRLGKKPPLFLRSARKFLLLLPRPPSLPSFCQARDSARFGTAPLL